MTRATGSAIGGGPLSNGRDGLGDDHLALRWLGDNPSPIAAPADLTALSNETRVNTATTLDQADSAVTGLLNGGFVVVWASNGQDGSSHGVYGQRYNAAGAAVGGEFPINSTTAGSQAIPSVSALDDGGFVVTWRGSDADGFGVFGQRYAANGAAAGGEFAVNQTTSQAQDGASVTGLVGGGFVVVWESFGQDGSDEGIYARAYGANGAPLGNEFRINQTTVSAQAYPTVAATADGGFAVSWASFHQDGSFTYNIYARTYDANLAASAEFPVNTTTAGAQTIPAAAGLLGGGFVIAWYSTGQDGGTIGVYAQRYGANGAPVGGEFLVNETSAGDQLYPSVTALANGGFAISWQSDGQDGAGAGTYARAFTGDGLGGDEILVNQTTAGEQATSDFSHQSIAGLIDGSLVVTWEGNGPGDADGIFQRRFDVEDVTIPGGAGADSLVGGAGGEQLEGKGGADTLQGNGGGDTLDGGAGNDWADYRAGGNVRADLKSPGSNTDDAAGDVYLSVENLRGSNGKDKLYGDDLANRIEGRGNADLLVGRGGKDSLAGGAGKDTLTGGGQNDRFELASTLATDADEITDFTAGDTIALDGNVFGLPQGALNASRFAAGNAAQDGNDRLIYNPANGKLFFDADGTGAQAQVLIATLGNLPTLSAADFVVI